MGWGAAELKNRFQWNFPIAFSAHDANVLYAAANVLFRSPDLGQTWEQISPDLTRDDKSRMGASGGPITKDNTSVEYYGTIFALAESHHETDVIWAGSDDGRVQLTRNGGTTWNDVTPTGLPEWAQINSIEIHPFEPGGVYIAATSYKSDDFRPYLYRTSDWGATWKKITSGIPNDHFTRVVRAAPDREGLLFAGTERGIYYSNDDGNNWQTLQLNLPVVPITDLAIKDRDLIAATQGRGYWILDDLSVLQQTSTAVEAKTAHLYTPRPAYRLTAGSRDDEPVNAGMNPHVGVVFHYALAAEADAETEISLQVFEASGGDPIWTWTQKPPATDEKEEEPGPDDPPDTRVLSADKGLNRFVWNMRYPGMDRFENLILWADMKEGPKAVPGSYRAQLTVGEDIQDVVFEIVADPRSDATAQDYAAQFRFVIEARDLLSRTHNEIKKIRQLRSQLENLQSRLDVVGATDEESVSLVEEINALLDTITPIEEALYQTKNESRQDPLNYPIRLNNKLTSLMGTVDVGDARPTTSAMMVKNELSNAIEAELGQLEVVWNENVPALNSRIQSMGIDLVSISEE
jgi:photosystem II stability/assembly factor-like uncharacterized protein